MSKEGRKATRILLVKKASTNKEDTPRVAARLDKVEKTQARLSKGGKAPANPGRKARTKARNLSDLPA